MGIGPCIEGLGYRIPSGRFVIACNGGADLEEYRDECSEAWGEAPRSDPVSDEDRSFA